MKIKAIKVDKDRLVKKACYSCGHETESLISDEWDKHLTQDKEYEVEGEANTHYMIRNDAGVLQWFFKNKFAVLGDSLSGKTTGCEPVDGASTASLLTK